MNTIHPDFKIVVLYITLVLGVALYLSIHDFAQKKHRLTLKNIGILWTIYTVEWALRILVYILAIPLVLMLLLLQPALVLAFLIATILLVIFSVGLFYEQPIVGNPPSSKEAFGGLITIVSCISIWLLSVKIFKSENALYERYANFFAERILEPVQQRIRRLIQKMDT